MDGERLPTREAVEGDVAKAGEDEVRQLAMKMRPVVCCPSVNVLMCSSNDDEGLEVEDERAAVHWHRLHLRLRTLSTLFRSRHWT
jgi:hypothetical protein